ncbi:hypothetical protein ACGFK1_06640 [Mycobacterium sp. NPDC048908]|uniref:hypothetical protein n=1 Tax=Mycobacterium sp. NPDC048908 TaxID=3364292 RepID=UPI0037100D76
MPMMRLSRTAAGLVAFMVSIPFSALAGADPLDPIPSDGFFLVGPDIAPGLYHTNGTASTWQVVINDVPTEDSMCLWFTYSTPDANKDHVVATNMSVGPMYATINSTVKAFESHNCEPWTRVT